MRIIIKLIKYILRKKYLNETCSGGIGSFLIFNLVFAYFLHLKRKNNSEISINSKNKINESNISKSQNKDFSINFKDKYDYFSDEDSCEILTDDKSSEIESFEDFSDNSENQYKNKKKNFFENFDSLETDKKKNRISKDNQKNNDNYELNLKNVKNLNNIKLFDNLGSLFMGFLNFYAFEFDYQNYGISNIGNGKIFKKIDNQNIKYFPYLCVENILDPTHNISRPVTRYEAVKELFRTIYLHIKFSKSSNISQGFLSEIVNGQDFEY